MTIPGIPGRGDLSPRRRQHHPGRWLVIVIVLALLGGGGYVGYRHFNGSSTAAAPPPRPQPCPTLKTTSMFAAPRDIRVVVSNASLRTGLAGRVARQLRSRGLHVPAVGNAVRIDKGIAEVQYSADRLREARTVAAQILGASLKQVTGGRVLELDVGFKFHHLLTVSRVHAAEVRAVAAASPSPAPTSTSDCTPS